MKIPALAALALPLALWGCADRGGSADLLGPGEAAMSDADGSRKTYRVLKGVYKDKIRFDEVVVTQNRSADVGIAGNVLIIPRGAVDKPTLFRMKLTEETVDGYTYAEVDLDAYQQDAHGNFTKEVGSKGFLKPLKLRLTYEWVTDPISNDKKLRVVWLKTDGTQEVYATTVDPSGRTVSTKLYHFSRYAIGFPD